MDHSDLFATLPTAIKAWKHPETESAIAYVGGLANCLTAFLVMQTFDFANLAFPIYLIFTNGIMLLAILYGSKLSRKC